MKRTRIDLTEVAALPNLALAYAKAARGKRWRPDVVRFRESLQANLARLGDDLLAERLPHGWFRAFWIHDPKKRLIHAACFDDRVFHHALMNHAGPALERAQSPASYACRPGRGIHRAVERVQGHLRRFPWYVKIDIDGYFASIEHARLLVLLMRRFKGPGVEAQFRRILSCHQPAPGRGLPIGALTSQYFANEYLNDFDRFLAARPECRANLRYMDDIVVWCDSRAAARKLLELMKHWLGDERGLKVKAGAVVQRSGHGIEYCGYRVTPGAIRLGRRRLRRYRQCREKWEAAWRAGALSDLELQQAHASVHGLAPGAMYTGWRRQQLCRFPPPEV